MECVESFTAKNIEDCEIVDSMPNDLETPLENISSNEANVDEHLVLYPCIGMEFDSLTDVKEFYTSFAKKEGFGVRTRSTKENFCILVCSNEGKHIVKSGNEEEYDVCIGKTKKKCLTLRTNCKALIVSKVMKRLFIYFFISIYVYFSYNHAFLD